MLITKGVPIAVKIKTVRFIILFILFIDVAVVIITATVVNIATNRISPKVINKTELIKELIK